MRPSRLPLGLLVWALCSCNATESRSDTSIVTDPHSFAEPGRVRVTHVKLDLALDFEAHRVQGRATLELQRSDPSAPLVLDTHGLEIADVRGPDGLARSFELGDDHGRLGRPLTVQLAEGDREVAIEYATSPAAEALQFLSSEQTSGAHPFLFTQGQAILTRSWIPLQDSPGVRVTYDATILAPRPLTVLMSAASRSGPLEIVSEGGARPDVSLWRFRMDHPIPSYLIALACGDLEQRAISPRCSVWAEPAVVDAAAREFADTENMVASAEDLFGPYRWERYDVLILPPAFPYGGMENPTLTFLTPTAIAGDRSLVSIIAHELAHSWSGNLVTNATWADFWLNEGFTVYLERRIMERLYGAERVAMEQQLAWDGLQRELGELEPWQTVLHIDLAGHHPDDGASGVPYNKGALFLQRVEELFGRERFDEFLTSWFDSHAFESLTTDDFVIFLEARLLAQDPSLATQLDLQAWLETPGLPADAPRPRSEALAVVGREVERLVAGTQPAQLATDGWVTQQWLHFLEALPDDLDSGGMRALDTAFHLSESGNSEILAVWLRLGIRHSYSAIDSRLEDFLMNVGRRKFLRPLYKELCRTESGKARARAIYASARPRYHPVSAVSLDEVILDE